ncbi:60 kDa SS-A Ro ribonucleo, partial [Paramuricea clavata]
SCKFDGGLYVLIIFSKFVNGDGVFKQFNTNPILASSLFIRLGIATSLNNSKQDFILPGNNLDIFEILIFIDYIDIPQQAYNCKLTYNCKLWDFIKNLNVFRFVADFVWSALLRQMPMTAMIRNLGEMTSIHGLLAGSPEERLICDRLQNVQLLRHARIHPFNVLVALKTYADGHGDRGRLVWIPNEEILEALKNAFYNSFQHVESTKKRYLLALDVSVSMSYAAGSHIAPNDASAAMSMVVARTETEYHIVAFSNEIISLRELVIDENTTLDEVLQLMQQIPRRAADCALPMKYAIENDLDVDVFVVYTDCETRKVGIQPSEALRQYREHSGIRDAKLIVVAMTSNGFTIADPDDPGMLDMAGFDSAAPEVMREFILGNI